MRLAPIYPILDFTPETSQSDLLTQAAALLSAGARLLQLRAKALSSGDFVALAAALRTLCDDTRASLIINDRADVALAAHAHGVHLGQEDLSPAVARQILGSRAIIGVSTHSLAEARRAAEDGADYVAWGCAFPSTTKDDTVAQPSLHALSEIRSALPAQIPLAAIGGITLENIAQIAQAGADAAAVIGAVQHDSARHLRTLTAAFESARRPAR